MALFQTFFHGRMGPLEIACLKSFVDHGHRVTVFSYEHETTPAFCTRQNARDICGQENLFFYKTGFGSGSIAGFSNMFRYALLRQCGGWWIDTDIVCLSPEWPCQAIIAAWQHDTEINTAVMRFPAKHPVMIEAENRCIEVGGNVVWGQTGPVLFTELLHKHGIESLALPRSAFYPVHYENWLDILNPAQAGQVRALCRNSFAVHLWNERFRYGGIQKTVAPPQGSYLHELLVKHQMLALFAEGDARTWQRQFDMLSLPPEAPQPVCAAAPAQGILSAIRSWLSH